MRDCLLLAAAATLALSPAAAPAQTSALSPGARHDLQCFMLYAIVAASDDESAQQLGFIGTSYFAGKLRIEAPGLDLISEVRAEAKSLESNPDAKAIGDSCDKEIQDFGSDMSNLGSALKGDQPSSSSS